MENLIELKREYNTLDNLYNFLKNTSSFECAKAYDIWEHRTNANGQMAECLVLKKSNMHAVKVFFVKENTVKVNHIIPSKMIHAYFGKSQKAYQNILEIVTGKIKDVLLAPAQKKAFEEMEQVFREISVS